jgi:hypothetical protein
MREEGLKGFAYLALKKHIKNRRKINPIEERRNAKASDLTRIKLKIIPIIEIIMIIKNHGLDFLSSSFI